MPKKIAYFLHAKKTILLFLGKILELRLIYFTYTTWQLIKKNKIISLSVKYLIKSWRKVWNISSSHNILSVRESNGMNIIFDLPKHISISPLWNLFEHRYAPIVFTQFMSQMFWYSSHSLISGKYVFKQFVQGIYMSVI